MAVQSVWAAPSGPVLRCFIAAVGTLGETIKFIVQSRLNASWRGRTRAPFVTRLHGKENELFLLFVS